MADDDNTCSPYDGLAQKIRGGKSAAATEYANRAPVIQVSRPSDRSGLGGKLRIFDLFGFLVARFDFQLFLNNEHAGSLARSSELSLDFSAGDHTLQVKTPLVKSRQLAFSIQNGQRFQFTCQTKLTGVILQKHD